MAASADPAQMEIAMDVNMSQSSSSSPPNHPVYVSPIRAGRTIREVSNEINDLRKENFNLKLRIFFLEEKITELCGREPVQNVKVNVDLQIELKNVRRELASTQEDLSIKDRMLDEALRSTQESQSNLRKAALQISDLEQQLRNLNQELRSREEQFVSPLESENENAMGRVAFGISESVSRTVSLHPSIAETKVEEEAGPVKGLNLLKNELLAKQKELELSAGRIKELEKSVSELQVKSKKKSYSIQALIQKLAKQPDIKSKEMWSLMEEGTDAANLNDQTAVVSTVNKIKVYFAELMSVPLEQMFPASQPASFERTFEVREKSLQTHSKELCRSLSDPSADVQTRENELNKLQHLLDEKSSALEALQNSYNNLKKEQTVLSRLAPVDAETETTDLYPTSYQSLEQKAKGSKSDEGETDNMDKRSKSKKSVDVQTHEDSTLTKLKRLLEEKANALEALQNSYKNLKKEHIVHSRLAPVDAGTETTDLQTASYHSLEQKAGGSGYTDESDESKEELRQSLSCRSVDVQTHGDSWTKLQDLLDEKSNALKALQNIYDDLKKEYFSKITADFMHSRHALVDAGTETTDLHPASDNSLERKTKSSGYVDKYSKSKEIMQSLSEASLSSLSSNAELGKSNDLNYLKEKHLIQALKLEEKEKEISLLQEENKDLREQLQIAKDQKDIFSQQAFILQQHLEELATFLEQVIQGKSFSSSSFESSVDMLSQVSTYLDATLLLSQSMSQNLSLWDLSKNFSFDETLLPERRPSLPFDNKSLSSSNLKLPIEDHDAEGRDVHSETYIPNLNKPVSRKRWFLSSQLQQQPSIRLGGQDHLSIFELDGGEDMSESTGSLLSGIGGTYDHSGVQHLVELGDVVPSRPKPRPCWSLPDRKETFSNLRVLDHATGDNLAEIIPFHQNGRPHKIVHSSESDIWSEPDRDVAIQRIGIDTQAPLLSSAQKRRGREKFPKDATSSSATSEPHFRRKRSGSQSQVTVQLVDKRLSVVESQQSKIVALQQTLEQQVAKLLSGLNEESFLAKMENSETALKEISSFRSTLVNAMNELRELKEAVKDSVSQNQEVGIIQELRENMEKVLRAVQYDENLEDVPRNQSKDIAKQALSELNIFKEQLLTVASTLLSQESLEHVNHSNNEANVTHLELLLDKERLQNSKLMQDLSNLSNENQALQGQLDELQNALDMERRKPTSSVVGREAEKYTAQSVVEDTGHKQQLGNLLLKKRPVSLDSLCEELKQTKDKLKAMESKCRAYEQDLNRVTQEKMDTSSENQVLRETVEAQKLLIEETRSHLEELQSSHDQLKISLDDAEDKIALLETKCRILKQEIETLSNEHIKTLKQCTSLGEVIQTQMDKIADMNKKHAEYSSEKISLQNTINQLRMETRSLKRKIQGNASQIDEESPLENSFDLELCELQSQISNLQNEVHAKETVVQEQADIIQEFKEENDDLKHRCARFKGFNESLEHENSQFAEELPFNKYMRSRSSGNVQMEPHDLQMEIINLKEMCNSKDAVNEELKKTIANLQNDVQALTRSVFASKDLYRSTEKENIIDEDNVKLSRGNSLEKQLRGSKTQSLSLVKELECRDNEIQNQASVILSLKGELECKDKEIQEQTGMAMHLKEEIEHAGRETEGQTTMIMSLKERLNCKDKEIQDQANMIVSLKEELKRKDKEIQEPTSVMYSSKDKADDLEDASAVTKKPSKTLRKVGSNLLQQQSTSAEDLFMQSQEELRNVIIEKQTILTEMENECMNLKRMNQELDGKFIKLQDENSMLQKRLELSESKVDDMKHAILSRKESSRPSLKTTTQELKETLYASVSHIPKLCRADSDSDIHVKPQHQNVLDKSQSDHSVQSPQEKIVELREELNRAYTLQADAQALVDLQQHELAERSLVISETEERQRKLEENLENVRHENMLLKDQVYKLQKSLESTINLKSPENQREQMKDGLPQALTDLHQVLSSKEAEIQEVKEKAEKMEMRMQQILRENDMLHEKNSKQMTTPRKKGSESAAELKEELIQKISSISHPQHTLKDPGKEILDLQLSYANIEGRLTQCCNDLRNKEVENDLLNDSLSRLRSEMNFLADSLNSEKQSNARLLNELSNQQCKLSISEGKLKEAEVERGGLEDQLQTALSALSEDKSAKQANVQKNSKSLIKDDREPVDTRKKLPTQIELYKDLESLLKYQTLSNTLEIENQSLKEQVSKLEYQLEDFRKKNMAFAGSSTHEKIVLEKPTQEKLENLNIDNLLLKERITDLEKQIRDHLSLLNTEKRKNSILSVQLIDLKDHQDQEQVSDVTEKVRDLANFMLQDEAQQNKIIELEKKLEVLQLHILEDDSIIHEQREERERLLTTLDMKTRWTKDLEDKLRETENELVTTNKSVAEKTNFINDLRAKFSIQTATMKAVEASKHDLENGIQQKIMENHENLTRFTVEKEALETKVSEVEAETKQLRVEIVNKDREAVLAEKAYKELEENFLKVENDYKVLCKNLLEKAKTINTLNADLSAKSNTIEQLEACKRELEREVGMQQKFKDVKQRTTSAVQSVNTDEETIEKWDFATMNVPSQSGKLCQTSLSDLTKYKDAVRNLPKIVTQQFPTAEKSVSTDEQMSEKHDFATTSVPSQSDKLCQISLSDLSRYKDEIPNLQKIVTQQVPTAEKSVSTDEETSEKRNFAIMYVPSQSDKLCQTSLSDLSKYKDAIPNLQRMVKWKDKQVSTDEQSVSPDEETREKRDFATMNVPSQSEKVCQTSLFDISKYEDAIQNLQKMLKSKEAQYDQLAAAHSNLSQLVNLESQPQTTRATSKVSKMTSVNLIDISVPKFSAAQQASDIVSNKILYPARKTLSSVVTVQEYEELQSNLRFQELVLELSQYIKISFDSLSRCIAQLAKFHAVPFLSTETRCPVGGHKQQAEESRSESIEKLKSENLSLQQELKESKRNRLILENQVQQLLLNIKDLEEKNSKLYNIAFAVGKQRDALPSTEVDEEETTNIKQLLDSKWNLQQSILRLQRELCKMHSSNLEKQMSFIEHVRNTYDKVQYYSASKPQSDSAIYGPMCAGSHITKEHYLSLKMDVECLYNTRSLLKYFVVPLVKSVKTYDSTIASKINSLSESINKKLDIESWDSIEFVRNVKECKLPADDFRQPGNERRFQKEMVDLRQELSTVKSENEFLRCELDRYKKMMPSVELQSEFETLKKSNSEIKQILINKGLFLRGADNSAVHAKGALNSSKWGSLTSLSSANSAKHSGESDHQKERFSVSHRNSKNYAESNANNQIIDDLGDSQVQRSHYSSPDLGIESDPNQEHVMLETGNLSGLLKTKQMAAPPPYDSMVNHVPYAFIILEDFELLKKEVEECIVDMKKIGSRANNGLEIISKEDTPKKSFTCSTLRRILDCCGNAEVCLFRSQKLMNKFKYSLFPADQKGMLAFDYYLNRAQQLDGVVVKLIAEKQKQDELLTSAMCRLQEYEMKKYLTERAMVKKLTKTKKVLRRLKHRDELKGAGSA